MRVFLWTVMVRPGEVPERASRRQHRLSRWAVTGTGPFADGFGGVTRGDPSQTCTDAGSMILPVSGESSSDANVRADL
jgi:hypothetical protein